MKLIFIRHAEPNYEIDSLTKKGFKEANSLTKRLLKEHIDYLYVSPLGRAKDTIKKYIKKTNIKYEILDILKEFPDKIEYDGNIVGTRDIKIDKFETNNDNYDNSKCYDIPEMINSGIKDKYDYLCNQFDKLLEKHGYKRHDNYYDVTRENHDVIVFVCHLGIEMLYISHLINLPFRALGQHFSPAPSSVTTIYTEEREKGKAKFRIQSFGDVSNLYKNNDDISFSGRFSECYSDNTRK